MGRPPAFEGFSDWIKASLSLNVFARLTEDTSNWKATGCLRAIS
jgi:hypothetical protein